MMNNKLKLVVLLGLCVAFVHFLLSDCFISPDYNFWSPSLLTSVPNAFNVVESTFKFNESSDTVLSILDSFDDKAINYSIAASLNTSFVNVTDDGLVMGKQDERLAFCPLIPPKLVGPIAVWLDAPSLDDLERLYPNLEAGGHGMPSGCRARHRVAIIVPYRDREAHLRVLLHNLHSLLMKQQLDYAVFVVEQVSNETFNRAKLMNVGYNEAIKLHNWQCFIFHDVDLIPEDDRNLYSCPEQPRHMSVAVDKFHYKLPYGSIFGGISALTKEQFIRINGFSNDYWGWGGEDDDLSTRVSLKGYKISRYPTEIARYKMIKHESEKENPVNKCRYKLMKKTRSRWRLDGLSSLRYKLISLQLEPLYTHIVVDLLENESRESLRRNGFQSC